jgi:hypothetical protein
MNSRKCPNCQLVNWADATQCARCAQPLTDAHATHGAYAPGDLSTQPAAASQAAADGWPPVGAANSAAPQSYTPRTYAAQSYAPGEAPAPYAAPAFGADSFATESDAPPLVAPFTSMSAGLNQAWVIYSQNFLLIAKLVLFAAIPFALGQAGLMYRFRESDNSMIVFGLNMIIFTLVRWSLIPSAVIYAITRKWSTGVEPSIGESYQWAAGRWLRVLRVLIVSGIITFFGFLLLIVPGVIASIALALIVPVALFEAGGVEHTLRRSATLTKGVRWQIFGAIFLLSLFASIGAGIVSMSFVGASVVLGAGAMVLANAVNTIVSEVLSQIMVVLALTIYLGRLAPAAQAQAVATLAGTSDVRAAR